jgi:hypothetical protein
LTAIVGDGVLQDALTFLAFKCLPEETSDDEGEDASVLVQSFHSNLTPLGTHHEAHPDGIGCQRKKQPHIIN